MPVWNSPRNVGNFTLGQSQPIAGGCRFSVLVVEFGCEIADAPPSRRTMHASKRLKVERANSPMAPR